MLVKSLARKAQVHPMIRTALRKTRQLAITSWKTYSKHADTVIIVVTLLAVLNMAYASDFDPSRYQMAIMTTFASVEFSVVIAMLLERQLNLRSHRPVPISYSRWSLALAGQ